MKSFISLLTVLAVTGCGMQPRMPMAQPNPGTSPDINEPQPLSEVEKLQRQVADLVGTVSQINALVLSDWATCSVGGPDSLTPLQQNICKIAQASTLEAKVQLKGELASFAQHQQKQLESIQDRLDASDSVAAQVQADVATVLSSITSLQSSVAQNTADIGTLTTAVAAINSQLATIVNGAALEVVIGNENLAAGPLYETILRPMSRSRITSYVDSISTNVGIANNGCSATNGSPVVTVTTLSAHGYTAGNVVRLNGFSACRGISTAAMNDQVTVIATSATTFTFSATMAATASGTGGGSVAYVSRINGRGLAQSWATADGEQLHTTTFSFKPYTFLITGPSTMLAAAPSSAPFTWTNGSTAVGSGWVCYDTTNRSATVSAIKNSGPNIVCK